MKWFCSAAGSFQSKIECRREWLYLFSPAAIPFHHIQSIINQFFSKTTREQTQDKESKLTKTKQKELMGSEVS